MLLWASPTALSRICVGRGANLMQHRAPYSRLPQNTRTLGANLVQPRALDTRLHQPIVLAQQQNTRTLGALNVQCRALNTSLNQDPRAHQTVQTLLHQLSTPLPSTARQFSTSPCCSSQDGDLPPKVGIVKRCFHPASICSSSCLLISLLPPFISFPPFHPHIRFKQMMKDYWYVLIPVHVSTSIVW